MQWNKPPELPLPLSITHTLLAKAAAPSMESPKGFPWDPWDVSCPSG